ncbi:MAG: hypothetical protein P1U56_24900 [Saprospiraceae bacterium]|nr:hypothetical protein [Saprospiraceae bacterium]
MASSLKRFKPVAEKYLIHNWWMPILFFFSSILVYAFVLLTPNTLLEYLANILFFSSLILLLISIPWQMIRGQWIGAIIQLSILLLMGFTVFKFASTVLYAFKPTDTFAEHLTIPKNIDLAYPLDLSRESTFEDRGPKDVNLQDNSIQFQLYNGFQPGLYHYDLWWQAKSRGEIYLKAYEITQETALSPTQLKMRSRVEIDPSVTQNKYGTTKHFTIYEGEWGQPYAARFEVWFKPKLGTEEVKLLEKNYIIEGWMR